MQVDYINFRTHVIYSIRDPITFQIVYIGSTSNLKSRISCHISSVYPSPIGVYMMELKRKKLTPIFTPLWTCSYGSKFKYERMAIQYLKDKGILLLNIADNDKENRLLAIQKYNGTN